MVKKIKHGLIEIPGIILKRVGLHSGDYVEVSDDGYRIVITPQLKEDSFTDEELKKIAKIAKAKKGRTFKNGEALLKYLEKISKK